VYKNKFTICLRNIQKNYKYFTGYRTNEFIRGRQSFSELLAVLGTDYTSATKSRRGTVKRKTFIIHA